MIFWNKLKKIIALSLCISLPTAAITPAMQAELDGHREQITAHYNNQIRALRPDMALEELLASEPLSPLRLGAAQTLTHFFFDRDNFDIFFTLPFQTTLSEFDVYLHFMNYLIGTPATHDAIFAVIGARTIDDITHHQQFAELMPEFLRNRFNFNGVGGLVRRLWDGAAISRTLQRHMAANATEIPEAPAVVPQAEPAPAQPAPAEPAPQEQPEQPAPAAAQEPIQAPAPQAPAPQQVPQPAVPVPAPQQQAPAPQAHAHQQRPAPQPVYRRRHQQARPAPEQRTSTSYAKVFAAITGLWFFKDRIKQAFKSVAKNFLPKKLYRMLFAAQAKQHNTLKKIQI